MLGTYIIYIVLSICIKNQYFIFERFVYISLKVYFVYESPNRNIVKFYIIISINVYLLFSGTYKKRITAKLNSRRNSVRKII